MLLAIVDHDRDGHLELRIQDVVVAELEGAVGLRRLDLVEHVQLAVLLDPVTSSRLARRGVGAPRIFDAVADIDEHHVLEQHRIRDGQGLSVFDHHHSFSGGVSVRALAFESRTALRRRT